MLRPPVENRGARPVNQSRCSKFTLMTKLEEMIHVPVEVEKNINSVMDAKI